MPRVLDKLLILVPGFCKHTTMVCFVCSYSVCFVGEWYHFSTFLPAFCFFVLLLFVKFHDMTRCINFPPPQSHLKFRFFNRTRTFNFYCTFTRGQVSKPPGNTMNSSILVPRIPLGEILRIGFWYGCDFFGYWSDERHLWSRQKKRHL